MFQFYETLSNHFYYKGPSAVASLSYFQFIENIANRHSDYDKLRSLLHN